MDNGHQYDVAFIVVTYNSVQYIGQCIQSILAHMTSPDRSMKIVIIDNGSKDGTVEILKDLQKRITTLQLILLDHNIGFGPANNMGFAAVSAKYYMLLNADAWLISDSVGTALAAMERRPEIAVCGLPLVYPDGSPQTYAYSSSSWQRWLLRLLGIRELIVKFSYSRTLSSLLVCLPSGREFVRSLNRPRLMIDRVVPAEYSGEPRPVDWVCGAAMVVAGDFLQEVHGFDPAIFLYGEDEDLCIEAHRRGRDVMVVDAVPVVHVLGWGANRFDRQLADLKYQSLRYFIHKNIQGLATRFLMQIFLPFHVYGWHRFYYAWSSNDCSSSCRERNE